MKLVKAVNQVDFLIFVFWFVSVGRVIYDTTIMIVGTLPEDVAGLNNFYGSYAVWIFVALFSSAMMYVAVKDYAASLEPDGSAPDDSSDEEKFDDSLSGDEVEDSASESKVRDIKSVCR